MRRRLLNHILTDAAGHAYFQAETSSSSMGARGLGTVLAFLTRGHYHASVGRWGSVNIDVAATCLQSNIIFWRGSPAHMESRRIAKPIDTHIGLCRGSGAPK